MPGSRCCFRWSAGTETDTGWATAAAFFDRTLAALAKRPRVIGLAYEQAYLKTIHPQPHDIPVDFVVTERGVYRRESEGLKFLDNPQGFSSPPCYAGEIAPGYFGEEPKT